MANDTFQQQLADMWGDYSPHNDDETSPDTALSGEDLIKKYGTADIEDVANKSKEVVDNTLQQNQALSIIAGAQNKSALGQDRLVDREGSPYVDLSLGKKLGMVDLLSNADNPYIAQVLPAFMQQMQTEQQLKNKAASELLNYKKSMEIANAQIQKSADMQKLLFDHQTQVAEAKDDKARRAADRKLWGQLVMTPQDLGGLTPEVASAIGKDLNDDNQKDVSIFELMNKYGVKTIPKPQTMPAKAGLSYKLMINNWKWNDATKSWDPDWKPDPTSSFTGVKASGGGKTPKTGLSMGKNGLLHTVVVDNPNPVADTKQSDPSR
jgi:hypothetical protein